MSVKRERRKRNESEHALKEESSAKKNTERALKKGEGKNEKVRMINIQKMVLLTFKFF